MSTQPPACSESALVGELAPQHSAESSSSAVSFLETSPTHASCVNTQDPVPTRPPPPHQGPISAQDGDGLLQLTSCCE